MLLSALKYITLKVVKNMTVFMSLILIFRKGIKKYDRFYVFDFNFAKVYSKNMTVFMSLILIFRWFTEMSLWNDYVVTCTKIYNFKCIPVFMSLIFILRRFTEMGLLSIFKSP